jgi:serine/threonine protein kinase
MIDLSSYGLTELCRDQQFVLYRGHRDAAPSRILIRAPVSERLEHETFRQVEHEYALRTELDSAWAVVPVALARDKACTVLLLQDPGGEPLDRLLECQLELPRFLQIAIGLAGALSRLHAQGIVHKDIKPANAIADLASGKVWLTGFGIASGLSRERQAPGPPQTIAGTLPYMAESRPDA